MHPLPAVFFQLYSLRDGDEAPERLSLYRSTSPARDRDEQRAPDFGPSAYVGSICAAASSDGVYLYCTQNVSDEVFRCIFRLFQACLGSCVLCSSAGPHHSFAALKADVAPWDSDGTKPLIMYDPSYLSKLQVGTSFPTFGIGDLRRIAEAVTSPDIPARVLGSDWRSLHGGLVARVWPSRVNLFVHTFHVRTNLCAGPITPLRPPPVDARLRRLEPLDEVERAAVSGLHQVLGSMYRLDAPISPEAVFAVWLATDLTPCFADEGSSTARPYMLASPEVPASIDSKLTPPNSGDESIHVEACMPGHGVVCVWGGVWVWVRVCVCVCVLGGGTAARHHGQSPITCVGLVYSSTEMLHDVSIHFDLTRTVLAPSV